MSLKDWFGKGPKGDWVRVGTDGKIKGDCAREPGEGKPKCMPRSKAHSMSKKDRATSAMRKRRKDPVVDRPGTGNKPINVKTDVKEKCWDGWKQMGMKKKGKKLVPNCVKEDKPSGKATKPYSSHGIPKDATKAELKAIRSNPNSSKGKKQLAHWKLNMHKEAVDNKDKKGLQKLVKGLKGSSQAHLDQMKKLKKMISDEYIEEKSVPNNPKLWAAKKAQAKSKFDVYPSAYANGWAAKQYKKAGGTWRSANEQVGITKKEKYMMTGRHPFDPKMGLQLEAPDTRIAKMDQLFRMGLADKGERVMMLRALKRDENALKDPLLRKKLYQLLDKMTNIITSDKQIYRQFRQNVQKNKDELQDVEEMYKLAINKSFESINISEDMSGMSVSSGHKRSVDSGAGMTKKGVAAYRRRNPGSKLQTAVTTPPSKLKKGSKAAKRRKAFCSRSRSWTGERGKAARRRWNC